MLFQVSEDRCPSVQGGQIVFSVTNGKRAEQYQKVACEENSKFIFTSYREVP